MESKTKLIVVAVIVTILIATLIIVASWKIQNIGTIRYSGGIQVYKYNNTSEPIEIIDWGIIDNGNTAYFEGYIYNNNSYTVNITYNVSNIVPNDLFDHATFSLKMDVDTLVSKYTFEPIGFELQVHSTRPTLTDFSFDINIYANEDK